MRNLPPADVLLIRHCSRIVVANFAIAACSFFIGGTSLLADDPAASATGGDLRDNVRIQMLAPEGWSGETITLPPGFSPGMKWRGVEQIRFAPGMFQSDSDSFFTYAFVFWLPGNQPVDEEAIRREMLTYYQGLARAVARGAALDPAPEAFTFKLTDLHKADSKDQGDGRKPSTGTPTGPMDAPAKFTARWSGLLEWCEPFRTRAAQTLRFEIATRALPENGGTVVSVAVSPQPTDSEVWKPLRELLTSTKVMPVAESE